MLLIPVCCPHCGSDQVVKRGTTAAGKQRYLCQNGACAHQTFIRDYSYRAYLPEVKQQMINMAVIGSCEIVRRQQEGPVTAKLS